MSYSLLTTLHAHSQGKPHLAGEIQIIPDIQDEELAALVHAGQEVVVPRGSAISSPSMVEAEARQPATTISEGSFQRRVEEREQLVRVVCSQQEQL